MHPNLVIVLYRLLSYRACWSSLAVIECAVLSIWPALLAQKLTQTPCSQQSQYSAYDPNNALGAMS